MLWLRRIICITDLLLAAMGRHSHGRSTHWAFCGTPRRRTIRTLLQPSDLVLEVLLRTDHFWHQRVMLLFWFQAHCLLVLKLSEQKFHKTLLLITHLTHHIFGLTSVDNLDMAIILLVHGHWLIVHCPIDLILHTLNLLQQRCQFLRCQTGCLLRLHMRLWRYRQILSTLVFVFLLVCAQLLHFGDLSVHLEL